MVVAVNGILSTNALAIPDNQIIIIYVFQKVLPVTLMDQLLTHSGSLTLSAKLRNKTSIAHFSFTNRSSKRLKLQLAKGFAIKIKIYLVVIET